MSRTCIIKHFCCQLPKQELYILNISRNMKTTISAYYTIKITILISGYKQDEKMNNYRASY
jgi:hypothetical protein